MARKRKRRSTVVEIGTGPARVKIYTVNRKDGYPMDSLYWKEGGQRRSKHLAGQAKTSRGRIYNVADSSPLHQGDCYQALAQIFERPIPPKGPSPENCKRAWSQERVSNEKLRSTGWEPRYPSFLDVAGEVSKSLASGSWSGFTPPGAQVS